MALPTNTDLQTMDYSYGGVPFVSVAAKAGIDLDTLDYSYGGVPFWGLEVSGGGAQSYILACEAGSYALTGTNAALTSSRTLVCESASGGAYPDMIVSGAGSTVVNDTWTFWDTVDGKPAYITATQYMAWSAAAGYWSMSGCYISYDDVATPDLVTTWELGFGGVLPLPTVTAGGSATLTEVAAFTVEMPTVVEMEVYEELSA